MVFLSNLFEIFGTRTASIFGAFLLLVVLGTLAKGRKKDDPPSLYDAIPFVTNTYQYVMDPKKFLARARRKMRSTKILEFSLGPKRVYILTGAKMVQGMFRTSSNINSDKFSMMIMEHVQWFNKVDLAKFADDKSGRLNSPAPGTKNKPPVQRYWAKNHHVYHHYLARTEPSARLSELYYALFTTKLEEQPRGEWVTIRLLEFLKHSMAEAATIALAGKRILEINPSFIQHFWEFDEIGLQLVWGLPQWLNPKPANVRARYNTMAQKFLEDAFEKFDWSGPDANSDWEPVFGSRFSREHAKWANDIGLSLRARAGVYGTNIFGINSNTIPVTAWAMIELIKDTSLLQSVRTEVRSALIMDQSVGKHKFDLQKLLTLPLLHSIYVESMRLHVSINITREVKEPMALEGYHLAKGAILQAPTALSHFDETVWGNDKHPVSEFWAARHVKFVENVDEEGEVTTNTESTRPGKPSEFFPYGGGITVCPGRHFAKQEIMLTLAMLVSQFDIHFIEWTQLDGSKSDRPPVDDEKYFGAAAMPPDRDVKIRWKRIL